MAAHPETHIETQRWLQRDIGPVLWSAFLAACFATMVFFAFFDPVLLMQDASPPSWLADRRTAYAIGFFFFWLTTSIASLLTAWLIDTRSSLDANHE